MSPHRPKAILILAAAFLSLAVPLPAQNGSISPAPTVVARTDDSATTYFLKAIEDNSFLVEEAFNQEDGVVQHISNATYFNKPDENFIFTFTQEWPLFGRTHQLSFTIPYAYLHSVGTRGLGDILVNYRYQLTTREMWAACAPRLSIILPTGNSASGLGNGVVGFQLSVPVSKRVSDYFIAHFNVGATYLPHVKGTDMNGADIMRSLPSYTVAMSVIWLAGSNYNFMLEAAHNAVSDIGGDGDVVFSHETIVSPGLRFAINIDDLQIVPGIAVPFSMIGGDNRTGILFYLSFEHPF